MLPPRCGFIPAGDESPFDRRVAQGCSDNWGSRRAFIGDYCGEPVDSCERRRVGCAEPSAYAARFLLRGIRPRSGAALESPRMHADQRLYRGRRAFRVRRADRQPLRPVRADRRAGHRWRPSFRPHDCRRARGGKTLFATGEPERRGALARGSLLAEPLTLPRWKRLLPHVVA
jgi:hypothetical protein